MPRCTWSQGQETPKGNIKQAIRKPRIIWLVDLSIEHRKQGEMIWCICFPIPILLILVFQFVNFA